LEGQFSRDDPREVRSGREGYPVEDIEVGGKHIEEASKVNNETWRNDMTALNRQRHKARPRKPTRGPSWRN
jgi:hypothetical protein